jgi:hypothetical protein
MIHYDDDRKLLRSILKYDDHVDVIKLAVLKNKIKHIAQSLVELYSNG